MTFLRRLVRIGMWCGLVLVMLAVAGYFYLRSCIAPPPALPAATAIGQLALEERNGRVYLGKNWFGERDGLRVLYLTGTPFERGYANGKLTQQLVHRQEQVVVDLLDTMVPQRWAQAAIKASVVFQTRYLPRYVQPEYQMEIFGMTQGCPDVRPQDGPYYHRVLSYHAAQDISYMLMNHPLVRGCTGFAAWGNATTNGHLLCARNFDWEAAPVFDQDRVLTLCEPDQGIAFASLAWAGMAGAVSGMNRDGICILVNGAPSDLPGHARTPTCMVAREVLQYAHSLAEAQAIIERSQVFVSALFLVGSRRDNKFLVIEKTPTTTAVQPTPATEYLVQANHYLTAALKDLEINTKFMAVDTSVSRATRMAELLQANAGQLGPDRAMTILRDRRLPGGVFPGNGHRGALNPFIATHGVVMDLTDGIFWAGTPPHQLGKLVAIDLNDFERLLPEQTVAADLEVYPTYAQAHAELEAGRQALRHKDYAKAMAAANRAETLNPGFYQNAVLLGEARLATGNHASAKAAFEEALNRQPALGGERKRIAELLRETNNLLAGPRGLPSTTQ